MAQSNSNADQTPREAATTGRPNPEATRRLSRIPHWLVALLLLFPILLVDHFDLLREIPWFRYGSTREDIVILLSTYGVLYLPGAVKRWKWQHVIFMLILGGIAGLLFWALWSVPMRKYGWAWNTFLGCVPIALLGIGEITLRKRMTRRHVLWGLAGAVGVSAFVQLVVQYASLAGWMVKLPNQYGIGLYPLFEIIWRPLLATSIWVTIPVCLAAAEARSLRAKLATGGAFALVVGTGFFMDVASVPLARMSLLGHGPFNRTASLEHILNQGNADPGLLWQAVEKFPYTPSRLRGGYNSRWRYYAIRALAEKDSAGTAEKLSSLFRRKPNAHLAEDSADLFVKHQRYETVPLLMRYALAECNYECIDTLEKMKLPRSALPVMRSAVVFEARFAGRQLRRFNKKTRDALKPLLGQDAGSDVDAWFSLYATTIPSAPTPLPKPIQEETDRVIAAMVRYYPISNKWAAVCFGATRRKGSSGEQGLDETKYLIRSIAHPNWDVLTTTDLEREIDEYESRVMEAMEKVHFDKQATTRPKG